MAALVQSGRFQKVTYGTTQILGPATYSISGVTRKTVESSEFGVDIDTFEFGTADGGTITLSDIMYSPKDTTGQDMLDALVLNAVKSPGGNLTSGLRFYINSTSYWQVCTTGGYILMTGGKRLESDRNGLAKCSYEGMISGGHMVLY